MAVLNIHLFNVHHGDSIVVEYIDDRSIKSYIVIDSNVIKKDGLLLNPAYNFLKKLNVSEINTLILSHLHSDHYTGIEMFFKDFKILKFIIPPFLSLKTDLFEKQLSALKINIKNITEYTSDQFINRKLLSFTHLLKFIKMNKSIIEEGIGPENSLRIPNIQNVIGKIYLPFPKIKGKIFQMIFNGDFDFDLCPDMNDISIAFEIEINGTKVLFSGDSTLSQWNEHKHKMLRDGLTNLGMTIIKAPHHGSKNNNTIELYEYLFHPSVNNRYLLISANGISHPHIELFKIIDKLKIIPACTNISKSCIKSNVGDSTNLNKFPKEFQSFLISYDIEDTPQECQGDIKLSIALNEINLSNSTGLPCAYRLAPELSS